MGTRMYWIFLLVTLVVESHSVHYVASAKSKAGTATSTSGSGFSMALDPHGSSEGESLFGGSTSGTSGIAKAVGSNKFGSSDSSSVKGVAASSSGIGISSSKDIFGHGGKVGSKADGSASMTSGVASSHAVNNKKFKGFGNYGSLNDIIYGGSGKLFGMGTKLFHNTKIGGVDCRLCGGLGGIFHGVNCGVCGGSGFHSGGLGFPSGGIGSPSGGLGFPSEGLGSPSGGIGFPSGGIGFPSGGIGFPSVGSGFPSGGIGFPSGGLGSHSGCGGACGGFGGSGGKIILPLGASPNMMANVLGNDEQVPSADTPQPESKKVPGKEGRRFLWPEDREITSRRNDRRRFLENNREDEWDDEFFMFDEYDVPARSDFRDYPTGAQDVDSSSFIEYYDPENDINEDFSYYDE